MTYSEVAHKMADDNDYRPAHSKSPEAHVERKELMEKSRKQKFLIGGGLGALALALGLKFGFGGAPEPTVVRPDVPEVKAEQIVFSKAFSQRIGLKSEEVKAAPLIPVVEAVGMVGFNPKHTARIGTRLRGLVRSVRRFEGDRVAAGDILAEIDSPELGEAQAQVSMLSVQASTAERTATREKALLEKNLSTAQEADTALAEKNSHEAMLRAAEQKVMALAGGRAGSRIGVHALTAPIEGTVIERHVTQGELVDSDHVAYLVADLDHLWVELDVFEQSLMAISQGDAVIVRALNGAGEEIHGRVAQVGAVIDSATRSAPVRIEIDNTNRRLRPGQAVEAKIRASHAVKTDAVLVPSVSITYVDGAPTVFVALDEQSVRPVVVELGDGNGEFRHVKKGLAPGQKVVTSGVFELKSELFR